MMPSAMFALLFAAAVAGEAPRPEYPRPQFVRHEWRNLNGSWTCELELDEAGKAGGPDKAESDAVKLDAAAPADHRNAKGFSRQITVPFCPESRLSGIGHTDFIPRMWYHRTLEIPADWNERILLHFGGVDYHCECFIDGRLVGRHAGGQAAFAFDIAPFVKPGGRHDLVLCVRDDVRSGVQPAGGQAADPALAPPPEPADMQRLFDGTTLDGWDGDPRLWSVRDGAIHGETTPEHVINDNSFLIWTGGEVGDFDLRLSFRASATNNSGIQYRSQRITDASARNKWVVRGFQHEIRNEEKLPNVSGFIYDEKGSRGRVCLAGEKAVWQKDGGKQVLATLIDADEFAALMKVDDWNDVVIRAEGNRVRHYLNGRLILDFTDEHPDLARSRGVVALQLHDGRPTWAEYRNIRLKAL